MDRPELQRLRKCLQLGQALSEQTSYRRRAPAEAAVPHLVEARDGLRAFTRDSPAQAEGWRLLRLAEESLLDYAAAIDSLERALSCSPKRDKRDLKRLAMCREAAREWAALPLDAQRLARLADHLRATLSVNPCDHTTRYTREWLAENSEGDTDQTLAALGDRGGYCDCEVLNNAV